MSAAPVVLADSVGPGGTAALVVLILIIACVGIFFAFVGSLRRLRGNVSKGLFQGQQRRDATSAAADDSSDTSHAEGAVTPDPKGPAAGGA